MLENNVGRDELATSLVSTANQLVPVSPVAKKRSVEQPTGTALVRERH